MRLLLLYLILLAIFANYGIGIPQQSCEVGCDEGKLISFLANMEVLSPESIFNLAINEIETICGQLHENLKVVEKNFNECKSKDPTGLYISLIRGVEAFNKKICCADTNPYIKKFYMVHPCLFELRQDFESCNGPADWNEDPDDAKICKTYKTIIDCYYIKSAKVCGKKAADVMASLIQEVVDAVLGHSCKGTSSFPYIKDVMPDKYLERISAAQKMTNSSSLLLLIGFLEAILYFST